MRSTDKHKVPSWLFITALLSFGFWCTFSVSAKGLRDDDSIREMFKAHQPMFQDIGVRLVAEKTCDFKIFRYGDEKWDVQQDKTKPVRTSTVEQCKQLIRELSLDSIQKLDSKKVIFQIEQSWGGKHVSSGSAKSLIFEKGAFRNTATVNTAKDLDKWQKTRPDVAEHRSAINADWAIEYSFEG